MLQSCSANILCRPGLDLYCYSILPFITVFRSLLVELLSAWRCKTRSVSQSRNTPEYEEKLCANFIFCDFCVRILELETSLKVETEEIEFLKGERLQLPRGDCDVLCAVHCAPALLSLGGSGFLG